ncbi:MAG: hypothetical protein JKY12_09125 [Sneathiella sp.]|nr:hypothetical protein [Sneathiella sp.]
MKRGFTILMAVGLIIFCAAIITIYISIGSVITDTIEAKGSQITQTKVTLKEADFAPSTGVTTLTRLKVANPVGFESKHAFSFDTIELWIDTETLVSDVLVIKSMVLVAPEIIYEITASDDNLRTLKKYIENSLTKANSQPFTGKKIIVENFFVRNGVVVVQAAEIKGQRKTAQISDIQLKDIGKRENGLIPAELIQRLMIPLLRQTTLAALKTDLSLSGKARNVLNGALDETENALNSLKNLLSQ